MRLIDADLLIERLGQDIQQMDDPVIMMITAAIISDIRHAPTITGLLTRDEIETIRIHMEYIKEKLCNKHRYNEAKDYQLIIDKLKTMMYGEEEEEE